MKVVACLDEDGHFKVFKLLEQRRMLIEYIYQKKWHLIEGYYWDPDLGEEKPIEYFIDLSDDEFVEKIKQMQQRGDMEIVTMID